jgi:hypothetical protein
MLPPGSTQAALLRLELLVIDLFTNIISPGSTAKEALPRVSGPDRKRISDE